MSQTDPRPDSFIINVQNKLQAIEMCISAQLRIPALVLIYAGMDFAGSVCRPAWKEDQGSGDFIAWVEGDMQCQKLGVRGIDLWGARCGLLHGLTHNSKLYRQGRANRIVYSWGNKMPDAPTTFLRRLGMPETVIRVEDLHHAFVEGLDRLGQRMIKDPALTQLIALRSNALFIDQPEFPGMGSI